MRCRICGSWIKPFISFGRMPKGNGFLHPSEFPQEHFFELEVAFCPTCTMVQLVEQPKRELMFNASYPFFTGSSQKMTLHFKAFAEEGMRALQTPDPFVVEIGSNDGTMLQHFALRGIRHLGIEPSSNVGEVARQRGISTRSEFFDENCAREIVREEGPADLVLAANVLCHISDLHPVVEGIKTLLKPKGFFLFEDPYLKDVIEETAYDQFYDEHAFVFSVTSIRHLFERHGLELVDAKPQPTHGGSMRFTIAQRGAYPVSPRVAWALEEEKGLELDRWETYDRFSRRCEESREKLKKLLSTLKGQGKRVIGYAATSKSTTVINYCGITPEIVEFICDTTPAKQGTFSPGMHIPVRSPEEFSKNYPDAALLFAWNHCDEIMEKEEAFLKGGGKWIVYVPQVRIQG